MEEKKPNLLNLHCHSSFSDGSGSIECLAESFRRHGHVCLVTSDHDYYMNPEKYEAELIEAQRVQQKLDYPILCGLEISLYHEEAVLVGTEACRSWLKLMKGAPRNDIVNWTPQSNKKQAAYVVEAFKEVTAQNRCGACLVHPALRPDSTVPYELFNAYEIMNCGNLWSMESIARMRQMMPRAQPVRGLDLHSRGWLEDEVFMRCCNGIDHPIQTEEQLIAWVRGEENVQAL
jgi:hypothetical protein